MNNQFKDPFLEILPKLDVHGETSDTVTWVVEEFIKTQRKLGKLKVIIVHGRHSNILKDAIHKYLKTVKYVTKYYTYNFNDGITIVELEPLVELL